MKALTGLFITIHLFLIGCGKADLSEKDIKLYDAQITYQKEVSGLSMQMASLGAFYDRKGDSVIGKATRNINMADCLKTEKDKKTPYYEGMSFCNSATK